MSEVTGPPDSKNIKPVIRVPEISKHDQKPDDQKPPEHQEQKASKKSGSAPHVSRDPAVSLSASVGHIQLGENLEGSILSIDVDGRPILITPEATFALAPDAGLKEGDSIVLNIITTDNKLQAELTIRNGKPEVPPIVLTLTLVSVKHIEQDSPEMPYAKNQHVDQQTGAYIPAIGAQSNNPPNPQTSLSSGVYTPMPHPTQTVVSQETKGQQQGTQVKTEQDKKNLVEKVTYETKQPPDPTIIHSSSVDMGALLAAQQSSNPTATSPTKQNSQVTEHRSQGEQKTVTSATPTASTVSAPTSPTELTQDQTVIVPHLKGEPQNTDTKPKPDTPVRSTPKPKDSAGYIAPQSTINLSFPGPEPEQKIQSTIPPSPQKPATQNATPSPREQGAITAKFIPGKEAQAILSKAKIPSSAPNDAIEVIFRAKQRQDPPQVLEVKVLAISEKPDTGVSLKKNLEGYHQPPKENIDKNVIETKSSQQTYLIETTAGSVEVALPEGTKPPVVDSSMIIIPPSTEAMQPVKASQDVPAIVRPLSLLSEGLKKWPAMKRVHELISSEQQARTMPPSIAQQLLTALSSRTASGGPRLTNSLLFMLAALKQGDASAWLGPRVENYLQQNNQQPLLNMIRQDISRFAALVNQPVATSEWQPIVFPLAGDDNSLLMALLVRPEQANHPDRNKDNSSDQKEGENAPTRFILEVHLSKIGDIQLDGLIREKNFDLKFRSLNPVPESMKNDMRTLFTEALDAGGYNGAITFYDLTAFPIDVANIINNAEPLPHSTQNA